MFLHQWNFFPQLEEAINFYLMSMSTVILFNPIEEYTFQLQKIELLRTKQTTLWD